MTTADEIQMEIKIACDKLGLSSKDMAKALNTIQPMSVIFAPNIPIIEWTVWRKTTSVWPRSSINGNIIFGRINKRSRMGTLSPGGHHPHITEFATNKELFEAKLRGDA
jgi:hypothetical protein